MSTADTHQPRTTVLDREHIVQTLREHLSTLESRFGVRTLSLFGSTSRDERSTESDVDLLADFGEPPTFRQYMGALLYLEDLLGCKVDLATRGTLNPHITESVERDLLTVETSKCPSYATFLVR